MQNENRASRTSKCVYVSIICIATENEYERVLSVVAIFFFFLPIKEDLFF